MPIRKRKISELLEAKPIKGLFTIGVDGFNKSVKIGLDFIVNHIGSKGTDQHGLGDGKNAGFSTNDYTGAEKTKLDGIESSATKNTKTIVVPKMNGTAAIGSDSGYAVGDHVHPLDTSRVAANDIIPAATKTKISYDSKGLVTAGTDLVAADIPNLDTAKITTGAFADARIASAANWNAKEDKSNKGIANGYASLDANKKIPTTQLPDFILGQMIYGGSFVPGTGVATLSANAKDKLGTTEATITLTNNAAGITGFTAHQGIYYLVSTDGAFAGISFYVGDWLVSTGVGWNKIGNNDAVVSVNGKIGAVTLTYSDVAAAPANATLTADTGTGTDVTTPAIASASVATILQIIWAKIRQIANVINNITQLLSGKVNTTQTINGTAYGTGNITISATPTAHTHNFEQITDGPSSNVGTTFTPIRRTIITRQQTAGYISRMAVGMLMMANRWCPGIISVSNSDSASSWMDWIFDNSTGRIYSGNNVAQTNTFAWKSDIPSGANLGVTTAAFGQATAHGSAATFARSDHSHPLPSLPAIASYVSVSYAVSTAGWHRILGSIADSNIGTSQGLFRIDYQVAGYRGNALFFAQVSFSNTVTFEQVSYGYQSTAGVNAIRAVYSQELTKNLFYLEVNVAVPLDVLMVTVLNGNGFFNNLNTTATAGSVPSGYLTKQLNFSLGFATMNNVQAATFNGLAVNTSLVNNVANQIARTNASGYFAAGYINTNIGAENSLTVGNVFYEQSTGDGYIRKMSLATFKTQLAIPAVPTGINQNVNLASIAAANSITGTSLGVTGVLAIANGGTGGNTQVAAVGNLFGNANNTPGYFAVFNRDFAVPGYIPANSVLSLIGGAAINSNTTGSSGSVTLRAMTANLHSWIPFGTVGMFLGEGSGVTNAPDANWWRYIGISHSNTAGYVFLMALPHATANVRPKYKYCVAGTWSGWVTLFTNADSIPDGNIASAATWNGKQAGMGITALGGTPSTIASNTSTAASAGSSTAVARADHVHGLAAHNHGLLAGTNYVSGGIGSPTWFRDNIGATGLRYQMLSVASGAPGSGWGGFFVDALWFNAYENDITGATAIIASKGQGRLGFSYAVNNAAVAWTFREIYHTGYKPTAADVGALALSGGTLTGVLNGTTINATNGFFQTSDKRLKKDINEVDENLLKRASQISIQSFKWEKDNAEDIGVIAQEVEEILPEIVGENDDGFKTVNYTKLLLLKNEALERKVESLEEKVDRLEKLISKLL